MRACTPNSPHTPVHARMHVGIRAHPRALTHTHMRRTTHLGIHVDLVHGALLWPEIHQRHILLHRLARRAPLLDVVQLNEGQRGAGGAGSAAGARVPCL